MFRYQVDSQSWTKVVDLFDDGGNPQTVMSIMAGSDGVVWGVAANHMVYSLAPGGTAWKQTIGWGPLSEIAGPDSYHLIGLTPEKTDRDGDAYNDIWLGLGGPPGNAFADRAAAAATGSGDLRIASGPGDERGPERPRAGRVQPEALRRVPGRRRRTPAAEAATVGIGISCA